MKYRAQFEERMLSAYHHIPGVHSIQIYENAGGYKAVKKALSLNSEEMRELVTSSGLRERGGEGFPTGMKWSLFSESPLQKKYLICQAHSNGSNAHKDRYLIENNPHQLIEGMIITAKALGVDRAYILMRKELSGMVARLENALEEAYKKSYLGRNIMGKGYNLDIAIHLGAGAPMTDDQDILFSFLSGKRAVPSNQKKTHVSGYRDLPSMIHFPETMAILPWLFLHGEKAFKEFGTERSPGNKIFSLIGDINKPGVYEAPMGMSLIEMINKYGEGVRGGRKLKLIFPAGLSSIPLTEAQAAKTTLDYETLNAQGSQLGMGSIIVLSDERDLAKALDWLVESYGESSCGECTPCREGIGQVQKILKIKDEHQLDMVSSMAFNIRHISACSLGSQFCTATQGMITNFRHDIIYAANKQDEANG